MKNEAASFFLPVFTHVIFIQDVVPFLIVARTDQVDFVIGQRRLGRREANQSEALKRRPCCFCCTHFCFEIRSAMEVSPLLYFHFSHEELGRRETPSLILQKEQQALSVVKRRCFCRKLKSNLANMNPNSGFLVSFGSLLAVLYLFATTLAFSP